MSLKRTSWRAGAVVAAAAAVALIGGCKSNEKQEQDPESEAKANAAIVQMHFDQQARSGAITGKTIYPYHFNNDLATLTPLGEEHVQTLAVALAEQEGEQVRLNVRRGDASAELYDARVAKLKERLSDAGVASDRVVIADALGGGKGISSKTIADNERAAATPIGRRSGGRTGTSSTSSGSGSGYQNSMQTQGDR